MQEKIQNRHMHFLFYFQLLRMVIIKMFKWSKSDTQQLHLNEQTLLIF